MEGIKFDKKLGILDLVLSGKKTMFRLVSKKRTDKPFKTKYFIGQRIAILQTYKDANLDPEKVIYEIGSDYSASEFVSVKIKESKGWDKISGVSPDLMPHLIEITNIKTEPITSITDEDCFKEGIVPVSSNDISVLDGNMPFDGFSLDGRTWIGDTPQEVFAAISNKIIKKDVWANNKMVDVYEFKLVKNICG